MAAVPLVRHQGFKLTTTEIIVTNSDPVRTKTRWLQRRRSTVSLSGALIAVALSTLLVLPVLIFLLASVFPGLIGGGTSFFSLRSFGYAFSASSLRGITDSLVVSLFAGLIATSCGLFVAWAITRTDISFKKFITGSIWFLLLVPTYLTTEGWQRLLEPDGVLASAHLNTAHIYHFFFGPPGVVFVLGMSGIPFAYLAISVALSNLGAELEDAARVHAGSQSQSWRVIIPLVTPALASAFAIVFAESMSDFGVAYTLAANAHFPMATYSLFSAIDSVPLNFGNAAAIGWLLVASALVPIFLQRRLTKSKSYAVVSGRRRPVRIVRLSTRGHLVVYFVIGLIVVLSVGVPVTGIVSASFLSGLGTTFGASSLTLSNYTRVFSSTVLGSPLHLSMVMAMATATATAIFGFYLAGILAKKNQTPLGRILDVLLLGSVALPGIVLGAGYIFSYNQPIFSTLGLDLYGTSKLLFIGYLASALPATARILIGPMAQVQSSVTHAARVHGAKPFQAWSQAVLPIISKAVVSAWLLTFAKTLLELPLSQLLYAPGSEPISVAINKLTAGYDYGGGTAMSVIALLVALVVIGLANGCYRLLAPKGWQKMGGMF